LVGEQKGEKNRMKGQGEKREMEEKEMMEIWEEAQKYRRKDIARTFSCMHLGRFAFLKM
jgi:hypothetical protein